MRLEDFERKLKGLVSYLQDVQVRDRLLIETAKTIEGSMKFRIFNEGKATNMQPISAGGYSSQKKKYTKDDFAGTISSKFAANTTIKKRNGQRVPAMKFENYAAFRRYVGRQTGYVDLSLSGSLQGNIQTGLSGDKVVIGLTSEEESKKRKTIEQRLYRRPIFTPSKSEIEEGEAAMLEGVKAIIKEQL